MPSISEAAAQLGCSVDTIRRRIQAGEIQARKVAGMWDVLLPDEDPPAPADVMERLVSMLGEQVAELRRQLEVREREVGQLHILLGQRQLEPGKPRKNPLMFWKR